MVVAETGFNLDQLVERRHLSTKSPFYADHLLPIPDRFQDGPRIPLPRGSFTVVLEYLARAHDPILTSETSSPGISLNGGAIWAIALSSSSDPMRTRLSSFGLRTKAPSQGNEHSGPHFAA